MAQQATFGEFDETKEDWLSYTERLQQYFEANEIKTAKKQRAVLLSVCGPTTYQLIRNLSSPQKPTELEFSALVELVQRHKNPRPSVIVRRFAFHSRQQQSGETVAAFVAELKKLSDDCNFGENLQEMLRDRLVCGIREASLQDGYWRKQILLLIKHSRYVKHLKRQNETPRTSRVVRILESRFTMLSLPRKHHRLNVTDVLGSTFRRNALS